MHPTQIFVIALLGLALLLTFSSINANNSLAPSTVSTQIAGNSVTFTLRNNGLMSIPLFIPGVMNPNLSPVSNSGVSLKIGQKILYKYKGKRRVLLVVTEDLEGAKIDVAKLIKEQKAEWDAGKNANMN